MTSQADHPHKVYVELTTRCNLHCSMCVKYAPNSCIPENDMEMDVFKRLLPSLAGVETLILNGIGESLLHPHLMEIIRLADRYMPTSALIGLQSNGALITKDIAKELLDRGLKTLCLSVDGFGDPLKKKSAGQHSIRMVEKAIRHLNSARTKNNALFTLGIEVVLSKETITDLPRLVNWAAASGVDYILTSHLITYDSQAEKDTLFNTHSLEAVQLYQKYCEKAVKIGLDFDREFKRADRFVLFGNKTEANKLRESFLDEARHKDIRLHYNHISPLCPEDLAVITEIFFQSRRLATQVGVKLQLPPLYAKQQRQCQFIKENATFISTSGEVMPCHFLWHTYGCRLLGQDIQVEKRIFGSISHDSLEDIWRIPSYKKFRDEAARYEYANCQTCPQGPCGSLVNDDGSYTNDCFGSEVPCGHCHWSLGGVHCL